MSGFIGAVNAKRAVPLTENPNLDQFAAIRFGNLTSHYQISHYGFDQDFKTFFAGQSIGGTEEYFAPDTTPNDFALSVQQAAPAHWQGLVDPTYKKFGFYIGVGPDYQINQPCSVSEIVGSVNQTQLLIQNGCTFRIYNATYVVFELST